MAVLVCRQARMDGKVTRFGAFEHPGPSWDERREPRHVRREHWQGVWLVLWICLRLPEQFCRQSAWHADSGPRARLAGSTDAMCNLGGGPVISVSIAVGRIFAITPLTHVWKARWISLHFKVREDWPNE